MVSENKVLVNEYDPSGRYQEHLVVNKELGRITDEELATWERAYRVEFLDLFGRFLSFDRAFYDRIAETLREAPSKLGLEALNRRDYNYLKDIRTRVYTFANMSSIRSQPVEQGSVGVSVTVNIGDEAIEGELERRAAARELLNQFNANAKYINGDQPLIEGEVLAED